MKQVAFNLCMQMRSIYARQDQALLLFGVCLQDLEISEKAISSYLSVTRLCSERKKKWSWTCSVQAGVNPFSCSESRVAASAIVLPL